MAIDLEELMRLDLAYPWLSSGYDSWALVVYLEALEEFIGLAQEQFRLRAKRELEKIQQRYDPDQYSQELSLINQAADEHIPRYAYMSALVPICGIFESTVSDMTGFISRREKATIQLEEICANNFAEQVSKYYDGVLKITLPWSEEQRKQIGTLYAVRRIIADRNGQFLDEPQARKDEIQKVANETSGLSIQGGTLVVSAEYVSSAAELVFNLLGKLNQMVGERYDGLTVPEE
jgi:hypothetical protein